MTSRMCDCNQGRLPCSCKEASAAPEQELVAWIDPVALDSAGPVYDAGFRDGCAESKRLNVHADPSEVAQLREQANDNVRWKAVATEQMGVIEAATQRADAAERKLGEATEAIQNLLAAFDNPISRRKLGSDFAKEAISSARNALLSASAEPAIKITNMGGYDIVEPAKGGDGEVSSHE